MNVLLPYLFDSFSKTSGLSYFELVILFFMAAWIFKINKKYEKEIRNLENAVDTINTKIDTEISVNTHHLEILKTKMQNVYKEYEIHNLYIKEAIKDLSKDIKYLIANHNN